MSRLFLGTHSYDANGNLLDDGLRTYTWDAADRLASLTVSGITYAYAYDGVGRRISETINGTLRRRWVWEPGAAEPSGELNAAGTSVNKRFLSQGVVDYTRTPGTAFNVYFTRDHLGSVRNQIKSDGAQICRFDYTPFGSLGAMIFGNSKDVSMDFGYTGHLYHSATGLTFTQFRVYDAETGRWLSRDPIWEQGGMNLYGYVGGNPLMAIDPLGLYGWDDFLVGNGGAAIEGVLNFASGAANGVTFGLSSRLVQGSYSFVGDNQSANIIGNMRNCSEAFAAGNAAGVSLQVASGLGAFSTGSRAAALWTGYRYGGLTAARTAGYATLESTTGGIAIAEIQSIIGSTLARPLWMAGSAAYVAVNSPQAVFMAGPVNMNSVLMSVELPFALMLNSTPTNIYVVP